MADQAEITRHSHPLRRVVICCTSVHADLRESLAKRAQDMGAKHVLDLTSEVTHLICGEIGTPKYQYVARMRTDVGVMRVDWIDAMYSLWIGGEDINLLDFQGEYTAPTFMGLSISVTGILELVERKKIEEIVIAKAATYHPDLTRDVSHLIAAAPTGEKYEFAIRHGISVVTIEWLYHSLERGMALEEAFYDPNLPKDRIGIGSRPLQPAVPAVGVAAGVSGRRKIRKSAEDFLGSQSQTIWSDIMGQAANPKPKKRDEWDDGPGRNVPMEAEPKTKRQTAAAEQPKAGILATITCYIDGFKYKQDRTVREVLESSGARIVTTLEDLENYRHSSRLAIIVPHTTRKRDCPVFPDAEIMTEWWIEVCLYKGRFVEPSEDFTNSPFEEFPLGGFEEMEICLTRYSGIQLLHLQKAIELLGGKFQDVLSRERKLLISNSPATGDKFRFAVQHNIPVVSDGWLQACAKQKRKLPFNEFLVEGQHLGRGASTGAMSPQGNREKRARQESQPTAEHNKRPQPSEDILKGRKVLGENMPLLGDRFKDKGVSNQKAAADAVLDSKAPGHRASGEPEIRAAGVDEELNTKQKGILSGCVVYISKESQASNELAAVARSLGAAVVESFSPKDLVPITHFIHTPQAGRDVTRYLKMARAIKGCQVVSPDWLYKSEQSWGEAGGEANPPLEPPSPGMGFAEDSGSSGPGGVGARARPGIKDGPDTDLMPPQGDGQGFPEGPDTGGSPPALDPLPLEELHSQPPPAPTTPAVSNVNPEPVEPPPDASSERRSIVGELLGRIEKDTIKTAMGKRRRPRGRLQGRASSNMSSYSNSGNGNDSQGDPGGRTVMELDPNTTPTKHDMEPPLPSQAITYADPEAEKERKTVRAKLSGRTAVETPKPAKRIRTAMDVDVSSAVRRRGKRRM